VEEEMTSATKLEDERAWMRAVDIARKKNDD